jgi:hypothetical protein
MVDDMTNTTLLDTRVDGQAVRWLLSLFFIMLIGGCAQLGGKKEVAHTAGVIYANPMPISELSRLSEAEQIRYFTDNVYVAASSRGEAREAHATAAVTALQHMRESLDKESFVSFWEGVDPEFFGRVNAVLDYADYTHPQVALDGRQTRTAYNLGARHLEVLSNLSEARRQAMQDLIELADKGDSAACLAFHKAYKDYANPLSGEAGITWLNVDGKPFRKSSMWAGSGEADYGGRIVQIAIPPQAVLGCRRILHPSHQVTIGVVEEAEQFFSGINLSSKFDPSDYAQHKEAWQREMIAKAEEAAQKIRLDKIRIVNVVDVYRIFPPALDYEYELAVSDGTLPEIVASGILTEQQAFTVEQRIMERRILLTGESVTPEHTPMAFLQLVSDRIAAKK